jgi:hypothetical protein
MAIALLRGLGKAHGLRLHLRRLDLSWNNINEPAGRAFVNLVGKSPSLKRLNLSYNPILNVAQNTTLGQKKMEEDAKKPGLCARVLCDCRGARKEHGREARPDGRPRGGPLRMGGEVGGARR